MTVTKQKETRLGFTPSVSKPIHGFHQLLEMPTLESTSGKRNAPWVKASKALQGHNDPNRFKTVIMISFRNADRIAFKSSWIEKYVCDAFILSLSVVFVFHFVNNFLAIFSALKNWLKVERNHRVPEIFYYLNTGKQKKKKNTVWQRLFSRNGSAWLK